MPSAELIAELPGALAPAGNAPSNTESASESGATRLLSRVAAIASNWFDRSIVLLAIVAIWEIAPRLELTDPAFLPPLSEVLRAGWELALNGQLAEHTGASLLRVGVGFAISLLYAIPLGLAIGWYPRVARLLNPLIEILRNTAPLALLPVFILLLGIGEVSKISLVVFSCSWPLLLNTIAAVQQVDPLLIKSARTMGATPLQLFTKVILPGSVPTIFVGVRLASAAAVLVLVASEMVGAKAGLGFLIIYSQYNFQVAQMYFGILGITAIGLVFNATLVWLERRLTGWRPATEGKTA